MSYSIDGKTAIVTGAANGIGLAIARHFADQGARVMFADMDEAGLQHELSDVGEDGNIRWFAGDLRERLTVANLLSATIDAFDKIDILVNASRQVGLTDPLDPEDGSLARLIEQNLMAGYRLTQQVARRMIRQAEGEIGAGQAGAIVNLSSIAARQTRPDLLGYSISTSALEQMTRSMALVLAPHRIRVNAVAFGSVMSESLKDALRNDPADRSVIESGTPLGRIAPPTEVAEAVQFLASDAAAFVTGQILTVDGGRTLLDNVAASVH